MSKHEIIQAYIHGDLDRRGFVTRLAALGVSAGAAAAYATQFAPAASAAVAPGGFVVRAAQTTDADYGTSVDFGSDAEAVALVSAAIGAIADLFGSLGSFSATDFPEGLYEQLNDFFAEIQQHADALSSLGATPGTRSATLGLRQSGPTSADDFLEKLETAYDKAVKNFVAAVPAVDADEVRQTLANIGGAIARHAGVLSFFVKGDGTPNGAFEEASK
ncbi:MAG TPA: ferritin-like domain-containing protein [Thermomicrobiales bacterium]|nr:ferritin-like domain-containing protein [Thermomicrobiales bacterium]